MIPDEAVEAAYSAPGSDAYVNKEDVRKMLKAAAPNMMASAWQRGYLYSYYQERGYVDDGTADVPEHLTDDIVEWNPHAKATHGNH